MRKTPERTATAASPQPERIVPLDSMTRVMLAAASRAVRGQDCADVGSVSRMGRFRAAPEPVRQTVVARAAIRSALPTWQVGEIDAERVAGWMMAHYPSRRYPGVVVGSPHGGAVHLAAALGVPWLPTAFEFTVPWPDGAVDQPARAMSYGADVVAPLLAANPEINIRQVHDPAGRGALSGCSIELVARWHRLPDAYRRFLSACLAPGAAVLLLQDARTWPVLNQETGHSFQLGSPASGLEPGDFHPSSPTFGQLLRRVEGDRSGWEPPDASRGSGYAEFGVDSGFQVGLREWADEVGVTLHQVLYPRSEALSAAVADVYRSWLRNAGKTGNRCVVECGRLLDPWQVMRAGLVPYWCEGATRRSVAGAEWWLAGSTAFSSVDVIPEPPGLQSPGLAGLPQWRAVAAFGRRRAAVDRSATRGYPIALLATRHATGVLRGQARDLPVPVPLRMAEALAGLRDGGAPQGLLVC